LDATKQKKKEQRNNNAGGAWHVRAHVKSINAGQERRGLLMQHMRGLLWWTTSKRGNTTATSFLDPFLARVRVHSRANLYSFFSLFTRHIESNFRTEK
jgi:hypothetical protein